MHHQDLPSMSTSYLRWRFNSTQDPTQFSAMATSCPKLNFSAVWLIALNLSDWMLSKSVFHFYSFIVCAMHECVNECDWCLFLSFFKLEYWFWYVCTKYYILFIRVESMLPVITLRLFQCLSCFNTF
jgi:hypothetical protein